MARYDAFVSYSHAGDGRLAPRLQSGLERFARPWWKRRVLRVFRDETGLTANPHLWSSIVEALDNSEWFVLLASPEAARSDWVGQEIQHWATTRDPNRMLVAVTDGVFVWDESAGDIDWRNSSAAHACLRGVFDSEPRYVDLTWARDEVKLDRRDGRFQDALADIAAPLRGIAKDDLAGEDVRQHRRTMRLARAAATALTLLTVASVVTSVLAFRQRDEARQQRRRADEQALVATARGTAAGAIAQAGVAIDRSLLLGAAAVGLSESPETMNGLLTALDSASALVSFHHEVGAVNALDVSPDGARIATVAPNGRVRIWRYPTLEQIAQTVIGAQHPYSIEFIGSGDALGVWADSGLLQFDSSTLAPLGHLIAPTDITVAGVVGSIAADGSVVAIGQSISQQFELFERRTGHRTSTFSIDDTCSDGVRGLDISTATDRVVAVCSTMTATFDLQTGALIGSRPSSDSGRPLFSPDGSVLAVATTGNVVELINAATMQVVDVLVTPGSRVVSMKFSDDGRFLAVGSDREEVAVYAFVNDASAAAQSIGNGGTWTSATQIIAFRGVTGGVLGAAFLPSSEQTDRVPPIIVAAPSGLSQFDQARTPAVATERFDQAAWALFDPAQREVYRSATNPTDAQHSTEFEVADVDGTFQRRLRLMGADVRLLAISPTGALVATGAIEWPTNPNGGLVAPTSLELQLVDSISGELTASFDLLRARSLSPPAPAAAQFAQDPARFPGGRYLPALSARISPDGSKLIVQMDGARVVWDATTGSVRNLFTGATTVLRWGTDGTTLVGGTAFGRLNEYRLEDQGTRPSTSVAVEPGASISDITPVPAHNQLLVTSESGKIWVSDAASLEIVGAPFESADVPLHQTAVDAAGTIVASLDRAGKVRLWRFADRGPIGPPITVVPAAGAADADIDFAEGKLVVSAPGSFIAYIPLATSDLVARACTLAGRQLTSDEWLQFVGDRPHEPCLR